LDVYTINDDDDDDDNVTNVSIAQIANVPNYVSLSETSSSYSDRQRYGENKMLSYRREIALQGALVLAKSDRLMGLRVGDNILLTL